MTPENVFVLVLGIRTSIEIDPDCCFKVSSRIIRQSLDIRCSLSRVAAHSGVQKQRTYMQRLVLDTEAWQSSSV